MDRKTGVGGALREARVARRLSLSDVSAKAAISVATLSRIENEKQSIDVALLIHLADIVGIPAQALIGGDGHGDGEDFSVTDLARELAARTPGERAQILVQANGHSRRAKRGEALSAQVDSLLAAVDLIIEEINDLKKHIPKRRR